MFSSSYFDFLNLSQIGNINLLPFLLYSHTKHKEHVNVATVLETLIRELHDQSPVRTADILIVVLVAVLSL